MHYTQLGLALATLGALWEYRSPLIGGGTWPSVELVAESPASSVPAPWLQGDPADSVYRAAREALNRRDFRLAANLFGQIPERFARSGYAADALYWQAFALYRLGGDQDLRKARAVLRRQRQQFPRAATHGDATALESRIQGELARRGDSEAAEEISRTAITIAPPTPPTPPTPSAAPEPPDPPEPPSPPGTRRSRRSTSASTSSSASCATDDDDMKVAALNALQQMDEDKARPILQRLLARRDAGTACLRRKAVFLIAQQDRPGTEDILLGSARSDPDLEVRRQAVFWLSQVQTDRAVTALDSILRSSQDAEIQDKAVFALSQQDNPRAQQALRSYSERGDIPESIREKAIFWLGQRGGRENAAFLRSLYGRLKGEELKKKVLFSLSQMGGDENGRWLMAVARDTSETLEMRKQALFWAGQGNDILPIAELTRLYDTMNDREMREQLIFVYSQREEPAALDKLVEIAKKDPSPELRKRALFWLGQSDDTRALQAIQEIIDRP